MWQLTCDFPSESSSSQQPCNQQGLPAVFTLQVVTIIHLVGGAASTLERWDFARPRHAARAGSKAKGTQGISVGTFDFLNFSAAVGWIEIARTREVLLSSRFLSIPRLRGSWAPDKMRKLRSPWYPRTFGRASGSSRPAAPAALVQPWTSRLHGIQGQNEKGNETTKSLPAAHCNGWKGGFWENRPLFKELGASVRKKREAIWSYAELSSCKSSTHKYSPWMFGPSQVSRILVNNITTCANVEMRKSMSANSRNPADLHINQQPFEQMPSLQSVTKVDGLIWNSPWKLCSLDFALANRCYSLRCKSVSEWHLGDLCKSLGPLRCNRQIPAPQPLSWNFRASGSG